jgi:hypothetical protein
MSSRACDERTVKILPRNSIYAARCISVATQGFNLSEVKLGDGSACEIPVNDIYRSNLKLRDKR